MVEENEETQVIKPRKKRKKRKTIKRIRKVVAVESQKVEEQPIVESTSPSEGEGDKRGFAPLVRKILRKTGQPEMKKVGGRRWWLAGIGVAVLILSYF